VPRSRWARANPGRALHHFIQIHTTAVVLEGRDHHLGIAYILIGQVVAQLIRQQLEILATLERARQHHKDRQKFLEVVVLKQLRYTGLVARGQLDMVALGDAQQRCRCDRSL